MNLHHDKEAFVELISGAANELAIPTNVIEKDYFVTIILKTLAAKTKDLVFKGGTSLTKCSAKEGVCVADVLREIIESQVYKSDYEDITMGLLFVPETYDTVIQSLKKILDSGMWN